MAGKWLTVLLGAVFWGLGANIDFGLAFGFGGSLVFILVGLATALLLWQQGFRSGKSGPELWSLILKGLAVEAVLFPAAGLIMGILSPLALGPGVSFAGFLVYLGLLGGFLAAVFLFSAYLLKRRIKPLQERSKK